MRSLDWLFRGVFVCYRGVIGSLGGSFRFCLIGYYFGVWMFRIFIGIVGFERRFFLVGLESRLG